jgi:sulfate adenylyltransferase subunit 1 (EFTu-like GTPase family)
MSDRDRGRVLKFSVQRVAELHFLRAIAGRIEVGKIARGNRLSLDPRVSCGGRVPP